MKVVFVDSFNLDNQGNPYTIYKNFELNENSSNYSLRIFGKSLISRNLDILNSLFDIKEIVVPKQLDSLMPILNENNGYDVVVKEIENEDKLE